MARPGSTVIRLGCVQKARWGDPGAIAVNQEFGSMLPAPTAKEREHTEETLLNEGCREPLVVWPWHGRQRLLLGYDLWPTLFRYRLPFRVVEKSFPDRQAARFYVIREHLERRCLGPLGASYLRGMRYQVSKQPHGGDRIAQAPPGKGKTAEALAEIFGVSPATIRLDARVAAAVEQTADACGQKVRMLLLRRDTRMTRGRLLALADLPAERQRHVISALEINGRLPRGWRRKSATITLPREVAAMAAALFRRLPIDQVAALHRYLWQGARGRLRRTRERARRGWVCASGKRCSLAKDRTTL